MPAKLLDGVALSKLIRAEIAADILSCERPPD